MAADSTVRQAFVRNLVLYLKNNGYDGADLDWEGPQSDADKSNEVTWSRKYVKLSRPRIQPGL
jgi:GH18 family chitinase